MRLLATAVAAFFALTSAVQAAPVQWTGNGHYYELVTGTFTQSSARNAAQASTFNGMSGYLATITSAAENAFVAALGNVPAYIGGSDQANEGSWIWLDGPEAGDALSYFNWFPGEPNNCCGGEDFITINAGNNSGVWNDVTNSFFQPGYIVEFSGAEETLQSVPVPAALPMMVAALAAFGWMRRRTG